MQLNLKGNETIGDVKFEFNANFPFLMLDFFNPIYDVTNQNHVEPIGPQIQIHELVDKFKDIQVIITPNMTVKELEMNFKKLLGLTVIVLRKSGNVWLEATATNNWTLEKQNEMGAELSQQM